MKEKTQLECYFCGEPLGADGIEFETDEHDEDRAWHLDCIEQAEHDIGERGMALLEFLRVDDPDLLPDDIGGDGQADLTCYRTSSLVLTDDEADERAKQGAENWLDDVVLSQIDERYHRYFNENLWIEDAMSSSGREFWIGSEAEDEIRSTYDGKRYYIYRR